ncbi:TadE/TadG family type IV pilus assembly protein [Phenylobacterium soli]|nr:pilus assembly protein TadG-related protein [Phenylobacterium soli]
MHSTSGAIRSGVAACAAYCVRLWRNRTGNVAPLFALMLVPLVAALGMAGEGSSWFMLQRSAQNVADQAALAAAVNACAPGASCATGGTTYVSEARAVAARYTFVNGANDTTVAASTATAPAPCTSSDVCYVVTIQRKVPVYLLKVLGFTGTTTTAGGLDAQNIYATAWAKRTNSTSEFCITTLSSSGNSFRVNGGAQLNLTGCSIFAPNGGTSCNGQTGSTISYTYVGSTGGSNDNCGTEVANTLPLLDPYAGLASANLPSTLVQNCGGVFPKDGNKVTLPASNQLGGTMSFSGGSALCGDVKLVSDVTVTGDSTLIIENGHLDLNGHTMRTATNASLTLVFSGTTANGYDHFPKGAQGSVLDFAAPTSGPWSGVAIYQDPVLTSGVDFTVSGSTPQFDISGLIYAPKATITLSGAINHATAGLACLAFFVYQVQINGTAAIFATPTIDCPRAGLDPGSVSTLQQVVLVQ